MFEREKADIKKRQLEAKASASEASKIAKVDLKLKEANAKYRRSQYYREVFLNKVMGFFATNYLMLSCH